ncbi:MAG: isopenicillin-N N-acyltransferase like protein [Pseudonocardiales bacterium]|jgi:isopenicillin-N N-acyltransferase-like protein|nr:isopenicillin-N N-acyltransferase like protein [Pseudonocardiales bacterium]
MTTTDRRSFPIVRASGDPDQRGRAYGQQARALIHQSISGYEDVFRHYAGWDWATVRQRASRFAAPIAEFSPASFREIAAIAEGANVEVADILALNTRSEIMFAASPRSREVLATECTSFALLPERTAGDRLLAGQNWDWIEGARATALVLEVRRDDGPNFVSVVEAGMLAKVGVNSSGVGLCTNTLISDGAEGQLAVPYHVLLRSVLDSERGREAVDRIRSTPRANSANYLVTDDGGFCVDLETSTGEGSNELLPQDGAITHANHFVSPGLTGEDRYLQRKRHTTDRLRNVSASVRATRRHHEADLRRLLADHRDAPNSVCQHPNPDVPAPERTCTVAGVIIDVEARSMAYSAGSPCEAPWARHEVTS